MEKPGEFRKWFRMQRTLNARIGVKTDRTLGRKVG